MSIRSGERGEAAISYAAILVLAAALIGVLFASGIVTGFSRDVMTAICRIFNISDTGCGAAGPPGAAPRPPGQPEMSTCLRLEQSHSSTNNVDLLVYRRREYSGSSVDQYGDGSIVVTTTQGSGNGWGLTAGYGGGFKIGGVGSAGASTSAAGRSGPASSRPPSALRTKPR